MNANKNTQSSEAMKSEDFLRGVFVVNRSGYNIAVNYQLETKTIKIPKHATIISGSKELRYMQSVVWKA